MAASGEPEKVDLASPDLAAGYREALAAAFPGVLADGVLDVPRLAELLDVDVAGLAEGRERYGLMWAGKSEAVRSLLTPSHATLVPDFERSIDFDTAQNVFIEGDNLEVLKLLQKAYNDKVKLIYIDPPYNTGNDFVYNDDFSDGLRGYLEYTGQVDDEGNRTSANAETQGRRHSGWLSMMYPRLVLARNLLARNGLLAVSIDDNEAAALRLVLDEVFGEGQFVASVCVKSRASVSNDKLVSPSHNYLLLYARDYGTLFSQRRDFGLEPSLEGFAYEDKRGKYKLVPVDGPGGAKKGNPYYEFEGISGYWRYSKETMQAKFDDGRIVVRKGSLQQKLYEAEAAEKRRTPTTWWGDGLETATATRKLKDFMGASVFDSPKPIPLVRRLVEMSAVEHDDIILDFFAGSGTTGHAVLEQCAEDGKRRRFVCVNLPEPTPDGSVAREAGYNCVSDITIERLRRAAEDTGTAQLRIFRLVASAFAQPQMGSEPLAVSLISTTLVEPRQTLDGIASEVFISEGVSLDAEWVRSSAAGAPVLQAGAVALILAFEASESIVEAAFELGARVVVFLEDGFAGRDALKANAVVNAKNRGITMKTV